MPYYPNPVNEGLKLASSTGDGYTINLKWHTAYPKASTYKLAYHIYMSTDEDTVFSEGVKYISLGTATEADIYDLTPGQLYHFAVRAVEYSELLIDASQLPDVFTGLKIYPTSLLRSDITDTDTTIPLLDVSDFPSKGILKIGVELINYSSKDSLNNNLILSNAATQRGFDKTLAVSHDTDGYDGYETWSPIVSFLLGREEMNTVIYPCQSRFEWNTDHFTTADGYHQVTKDLLTSDLSISDATNEDFPTYDYAGWHRTNPVDLLTGICVGSYIGGEQFCADGYSGVGRVLRGLTLQDQNNQRQEMLLNITGRPALLLQLSRTGITCSCYKPTSEYPDPSCPKCYGTKFVMGYKQYFNPRRSDGRILVRVGPADEDVKMQEAGLESEFTLDMWTLTVPTIKDRDIVILFDMEGNEEFRYEVLSVNRNNTIVGLQGMQKFRAQRIRKYDVAYKIKAFRDTSTLPEKLMTGVGSALPGIVPHTHEIVITNQNPSNFGQLTSINQGHNHPVIWKDGQLQVVEVLGHTHTIIL